MKEFQEKYSVKETIYTNELAIGKILLLIDKYGCKYAAKQYMKNRIRNPVLHEFTKNELAMQTSLGKLSNNIVKVLDYYEDHESYVMVMEYSYQPTYFEDLLENVILK